MGALLLPGDADASEVERGQGGGQESQSFSILASACIRQMISPGEHLGEHIVVISALWFVAAGHVSCCVIKGTSSNI